MSRHGQPSASTIRQQVQLPKRVAIELRRQGHLRGPQGMRISVTTAITLFLGMPTRLRDELYKYVRNATWTQGRDVTPSELWAAFERICGDPGYDADKDEKVTRVDSESDQDGGIEGEELVA